MHFQYNRYIAHLYSATVIVIFVERVKSGGWAWFLQLTPFRRSLVPLSSLFSGFTSPSSNYQNRNQSARECVAKLIAQQSADNMGPKLKKPRAKRCPECGQQCASFATETRRLALQEKLQPMFAFPYVCYVSLSSSASSVGRCVRACLLMCEHSAGVAVVTCARLVMARTSATSAVFSTAAIAKPKWLLAARRVRRARSSVRRRRRRVRRSLGGMGRKGGAWEVSATALDCPLLLPTL
jgi:hypothetical protein